MKIRIFTATIDGGDGEHHPRFYPSREALMTDLDLDEDQMDGDGYYVDIDEDVLDISDYEVVS